MIINLDKPIEDIAKCNETKCEQKTHCLRYLLKPTRIHDVIMPEEIGKDCKEQIKGKVEYINGHKWFSLVLVK